MEVCEICGGEEFRQVPAKERMFGLAGDFEYSECNNCKGLYLNTIPQNMGEYYPSNYYSFVGFNTSHGTRRWLKRLRFQLFKLGINPSPPMYFEWIKTLNAKANSKIADIGCGNGQLLEELSYCGFKNLHGYDPFLVDDKSSDTVQLHKLNYYEIEEKYDVIMFHHAFEHIEHPAKIFEKLVDILNPNGVILIRVPVTDSLVWKENGAYWYQLDAPRHVFIPNTKSMEILADRFNLDLYNLTFDSFECQFWGTELYKRGKVSAGTIIEDEFSKEELDKFRKLSLEYNRKKIGDQACFYFRKR